MPDRQLAASFARTFVGLFDRLLSWMTEHLKSTCKAIAPMPFWRSATRTSQLPRPPLDLPGRWEPDPRGSAAAERPSLHSSICLETSPFDFQSLLAVTVGIFSIKAWTCL